MTFPNPEAFVYTLFFFFIRISRPNLQNFDIFLRLNPRLRVWKGFIELICKLNTVQFNYVFNLTVENDPFH